MSLVTWIFLNFFLFSVHGIVRAGHVKIIFSGRCITRPKNSIFSSQNLGRVRSPPLKICFYPPLQIFFVVVLNIHHFLVHRSSHRIRDEQIISLYTTLQIQRILYDNVLYIQFSDTKINPLQLKIKK